MTDNERPMTLEEAAEFLSLSKVYVRNLCVNKILKAYKVGGEINGQWRIWKHDAIEYVNRRSNTGE